MKFLLTKLFISVFFTSCGYAADMENFESFFSNQLFGEIGSSSGIAIQLPQDPDPTRFFLDSIPTNREDYENLSKNGVIYFRGFHVGFWDGRGETVKRHQAILSTFLGKIGSDEAVENKILTFSRNFLVSDPVKYFDVYISLTNRYDGRTSDDSFVIHLRAEDALYYLPTSLNQTNN